MRRWVREHFLDYTLLYHSLNHSRSARTASAGLPGKSPVLRMVGTRYIIRVRMQQPTSAIYLAMRRSHVPDLGSRYSPLASVLCRLDPSLASFSFSFLPVFPDAP